MAFIDYIFPGKDGLKGPLLDEYLAEGYYRMQHKMFTTHFTFLDTFDGGTPVFWLRINLKKILEGKAATAIRKKCRHFKVCYGKAAIDDEVDELYNLYREHVDFNTAVTCDKYLHDESDDPFDSCMITIRNDESLIAAGFFDKGEAAITGILNFYHPAYYKFSLGKYLMLKKIDYALAAKMSFYYTGYIGTSISKFDYKLFPDEHAVEVYLPLERIWVAYSATGKRKLEEYFVKYLI